MTSQPPAQEQSNAGQSSILRGKRAIVFGAGGSIGSAVSREFAAEGAEVYLAGRNQANVHVVMSQIKAAGGRAHSEVIDALDDSAVNEYMDAIGSAFGAIESLMENMAVELGSSGVRVGFARLLMWIAEPYRTR